MIHFIKFVAALVPNWLLLDSYTFFTSPPGDKLNTLSLCLETWLKFNNFNDNFLEELKHKDIATFDELLLELTKIEETALLSREWKILIQLQRTIVLQTWLETNLLTKYSKLIDELPWTTLDSFLQLLKKHSIADVSWYISPHDYQKLNKLLKNGLSTYEAKKLFIQWATTACSNNAWDTRKGREVNGSIFALLTQSVKYAGFGLLLSLVLISLCQYHSTSLKRKLYACQEEVILNIQQMCHGVFNGKALNLQKFELEWSWVDPQCVGGSFFCTVQFYNFHKEPYTIQDYDNFCVTVKHDNKSLPVCISSVDNDHDQDTSPKVKVAWSVHKAGVYSIDISVAGQTLRGCPHLKEFFPREVSVDQSCVFGQGPLVLATSYLPISLQVQLRDQFGNPCGAQLWSPEQHLCVTLSLLNSHTAAESPLITEVKFDDALQRHTVIFKASQEGVYRALVTWDMKPVTNGSFTLLVISESDNTLLTKEVSKKGSDNYYEAHLFTSDNNRMKGKRVYCYITPRQFIIKEFFMKLFPHRLYTFRVSPFTKVEFLDCDNYYGEPALTISDGFQSTVKLSSPNRDLIVASFLLHQIKNMGGSERFEDKSKYFYEKLQKMHIGKGRGLCSLKINRSNILFETFKAVKWLSASEWCHTFEVTFSGEIGLDFGGIRREWMELLCREIFDPTCSEMFVTFTNNSQGLAHPNPNPPNNIQLKHYEFAGKVVAKCLYDSSAGSSRRQLVRARLSRSFLAQLVGIRVTYKHFQQDDPDFFNSKIKYIEENDVSDLDLTFIEEEFVDGRCVKVVELVPGGRSVSVDNSNKHLYLDMLAQYRLVTKVKVHVDAFKKGLGELVPDSLLAVFDENELELLLCGLSEVSVEDLRQHHTVLDVHYPHFSTVLNWFWIIISGFNNEEMARLLQFITGCSQLPPGGFADLSPLIQIGQAPSCDKLPTAHTCFNHLCLPDYSDIHIMHSALLTAITDGNQGFGLI